uniref:Uncharacterized protein n=1 Tax=Pristionchus pacificus TaxID=54126 RepID=A0A2A6CWP7_PRIPA
DLNLGGISLDESSVCGHYFSVYNGQLSMKGGSEDDFALMSSKLPNAFFQNDPVNELRDIKQHLNEDLNLGGISLDESSVCGHYFSVYNGQLSMKGGSEDDFALMSSKLPNAFFQNDPVNELRDIKQHLNEDLNLGGISLDESSVCGHYFSVYNGQLSMKGGSEDDFALMFSKLPNAFFQNDPVNELRDIKQHLNETCNDSKSMQCNLLLTRLP